MHSINNIFKYDCRFKDVISVKAIFLSTVIDIIEETIGHFTLNCKKTIRGLRKIMFFF